MPNPLNVTVSHEERLIDEYCGGDTLLEKVLAELEQCQHEMTMNEYPLTV